VDQSDLEPMITPTSALIVEPLRLCARRRVKKQQATRDDRRGLYADHDRNIYPVQGPRSIT
jgi:hypothetical protein